MTATPPTVDDELVKRLRAHLDAAHLVEFTAIICLEHVRSRFNLAFGLTGQEFKDHCTMLGSVRDAHGPASCRGHVPPRDGAPPLKPPRDQHGSSRWRDAACGATVDAALRWRWHAPVPPTAAD